MPHLPAETLTRREIEVLTRLDPDERGAIKTVAQALDVSVRTAGVHLHNAYRKLGARSKREAKQKFLELCAQSSPAPEEPTLRHRWIWPAQLRTLIDGDTIDFCVDRGFGDRSMSIRVRLFGLNTPEMKDAPHGAGAKAAAETWLQTHVRHADVPAAEWGFLLETFKNTRGADKKDSFARWIARVRCATCGACLNDYLLQNEFAVPFMDRP